uniref:Candidate secreted effector n=1 Tax=Meloidogyne incognita TaxID=6306 RepID=A0A914MP71_MELIC
MNNRIFFNNEVLMNSIFANQSIRNSLVRFNRKIVVALSSNSFHINKRIRNCNSGSGIRRFSWLDLCIFNRVDIIEVLFFFFFLFFILFFIFFFGRSNGWHFNVNIGFRCRHICS